MAETLSGMGDRGRIDASGPPDAYELLVSEPVDHERDTEPRGSERTAREAEREARPAFEPSKGRILRFLQRGGAPKWGSDPREYDPVSVERTLGRVGRLFGPGRWFRLDVRGWEHVPPGPAMVVSNHSGGTTIPDVWGFLVAWYRRFGARRPLHPMAHEMVLSTKLTGPYFARRGVLRASPEVGARVLRDFGRDLLVMPGGDIDTWRPFSKRYEVRFGGRVGYARLALELGVPVVPLANAGAHETLLVLTDGQRIARALGLHDLTRAEIFPVHISAPWGLAVGPWPHLPIPAKLRYRIGPAIYPPREAPSPAASPSEASVRALDERVRAEVQRLLYALRDERS